MPRRRTSSRLRSFEIAGVPATSILRDLPRWLLLLALIYVPWDYGGTTSRSITVMNVLLAVAVASWLVHLAIVRRRPELPVILAASAAALVALGWWMAFNSRSIYDTGFDVYVPVTGRIEALAGSVDGLLSSAWMVRATLLLATICLVADLAGRPNWLMRLWIALGIGGGSIALLGLIQKAADAPMIFWGAKTWLPPYKAPPFFATFYYHGNAGAFLNLCFPVAAGLALRAFQKNDAPVQRAVWFSATLFILLAMITNTSRAAQVIGVAAVLAFAAWPARRALRAALGTKPLAVIFTAAVAGIAFVAIAQSSSVKTPLERWTESASKISTDARWTAYKGAARAVPDAGWFGFGPGTFRVFYPQYEEPQTGDYLALRHLHQDYLQTLLEWGWLGSAGWAVLFGGGILTAVLALRRTARSGERMRIHRILPIALIALATVMLHALVDFPLQVASLQLYTATYLGICWGSYRRTQSGESA